MEKEKYVRQIGGKWPKTINIIIHNGLIITPLSLSVCVHCGSWEQGSQRTHTSGGGPGLPEGGDAGATGRGGWRSRRPSRPRHALRSGRNHKKHRLLRKVIFFIVYYLFIYLFFCGINTTRPHHLVKDVARDTQLNNKGLVSFCRYFILLDCFSIWIIEMVEFIGNREEIIKMYSANVYTKF